MFWRGTMTNMLLITDEADNHTNQFLLTNPNFTEKTVNGAFE